MCVTLKQVMLFYKFLYEKRIFKILVVDLYAKLIDADGKLDKQYTNDGLHLTGPGLMQWKRVLTEMNAQL